MRNQLSTSVVICAYTERRWDELQAAVRSMQTQTMPPDELIVVIDHNPTLFEMARNTLSGVQLNLQIIENVQKQGLSGARNSGVAAATKDIVAFMDEDATAAEDWLEQLIQHLASDEVVMGVGGTIQPMWQEGKPAWFPEEFNWVVGCTYTGMPETTTPVRNLIGCNMSFRRHLLLTAGGFRDGMGRIGTLPVGCEETELCIRALQRWPDQKLLYVPQARVLHRVPADRATWQYFFSRCFAEGISKSQVANFVGTKDGLSNERSYVQQTLPLGILRSFTDLITRRDLGGIGRAVAIVTGLVATTAGYVKGRFANRQKQQPMFILSETSVSSHD
jgi:GT2 family glycosyltransferase